MEVLRKLNGRGLGMKPQIIQDFQSQILTTGQRISSCKQGKGSLIPKTISKALKQRLEYETNN